MSAIRVSKETKTPSYRLHLIRSFISCITAFCAIENLYATDRLVDQILVTANALIKNHVAQLIFKSNQNTYITENGFQFPFTEQFIKVVSESVSKLNVNCHAKVRMSAL